MKQTITPYKPPYMAMIYHNKANALYNLKRYNESLLTFNRALDIDPNYAKAYFGKGISLAQLGENIHAIKCYDKVIALDSQYDNDMYHNKGSAFFALGKYNEAIKYYNKALEIDPNNPNTLKDKKECINRIQKNARKTHMKRANKIIKSLDKKK